ncbi:MAG TPA: pilin [Rhodanobacteraceae bacterium]
METESGTSGSDRAAAQVSGFRAILAAVVLAAIALALILFYFHQQKTDPARAQIGAALASTDGVRVAVAIYHARSGAWPPDYTAAGLLSPSAAPGEYIDDIHVENGTIVVTLGGRAERALQGKRVELAPWLDAKVVKWRCTSQGVDADLLPRNCR